MSCSVINVALPALASACFSNSSNSSRVAASVQSRVRILVFSGTRSW